jgi:hypothetical protein
MSAVPTPGRANINALVDAACIDSGGEPDMNGLSKNKGVIPAYMNTENKVEVLIHGLSG